jgi:hypothetical protein
LTDNGGANAARRVTAAPGKGARWRKAVRNDLQWQGVDAAGAARIVVFHTYVLGLLRKPVLRDWLFYLVVVFALFSRGEWVPGTPSAIASFEDSWPEWFKIPAGIVLTAGIVLVVVGVLRRLIVRHDLPGVIPIKDVARDW